MSGINIPRPIIAILETLENHGHMSFIVGGAIRDWLLGHAPTEFDVATTATPDQVIHTFKTVIKTGINYGTVTVIWDGHPVEITTCRRESGYINARQPTDVDFVTDIFEDLARRDFTVNAMAYDPLFDVFLDPFNGQHDATIKRLVAVGDPLERLTEDTLRPYRAFRLMAEWGFLLDATVVTALTTITTNDPRPPLPSASRIRRECDRLLMGPHWQIGVTAMIQYGWWPPLPSSNDPVQYTEPPTPLPAKRDYRWAWLLQWGPTESLIQFFEFSKKDRARFKAIYQWQFNESAIELTLNDLAMSSSELMEYGYQTRALGMIQHDLLTRIRQGLLQNNPTAIRQFLSQKNPPTTEC